jgi:competence protein ComEC
LEDRLLTVEGRIVSLPLKLNGGQRFIFEVDQLLDKKGNAHAHPGKIRLNWYGGNEELVPGEYWRLQVKLKQAHGFSNPGGFDYEAWLFQQRIRATGYVVRKKGNERLQDARPYYIHRLRYLMSKKLSPMMKERDNASLLPALVIGDRSGVQPDQWRILTTTGTSHLLAISGLHIGLVATFVFFLHDGSGLLGVSRP